MRRLDVSESRLPRELGSRSTHGVGLGQAVEIARNLGRLPERLIVFGVEGRRYVIGDDPSPEVLSSIEHELSLAKDIIARALAELEGRLGRVAVLHIRLGPTDHVKPEALTLSLQAACKGTAADKVLVAIRPMDERGVRLESIEIQEGV